MPEDPIIKALYPFTTCDCSDALLKLKYPNGGFLAGPTMWSPKRQEGDTKIIGRAYTIDSVPKGSVVFISSPPNIPNAVYGGLMSARAQTSGAVGTVVDGRIRDLQEHRDLGFPIFAHDIGTASPNELVKVVAIGVPVKISSPHQDMTVNPGDYIVADLNGVVVVPQDLAEQAVQLMQPQVDADEKMAEVIKAGMSFTEASKKFRSK
ncbi:MAG: hypothetical protein TREMPRED_004606 [Tremellales sp. Tagirdzhanova-0007]|nr:MAG: hypothetical protein TREMPRED_004606 [Tremellales sp. Tagirdzhanova-0007]